MFQNIVVGSDGSASAGEAVRQAIEVARATRATLHVVCAYRSAVSLVALGAEFGAPSPASIDAVEQDLERLSERIGGEAARLAEASGVRAETYTPAGDPADAIIEVAETVSADVIFVGNRGHTTGKRFLLGSIAGRVAHHAPCHVMIVHTSG